MGTPLSMFKAWIRPSAVETSTVLRLNKIGVALPRTLKFGFWVLKVQIGAPDSSDSALILPSLPRVMTRFWLMRAGDRVTVSNGVCQITLPVILSNAMMTPLLSLTTATRDCSSSATPDIRPCLSLVLQSTLPCPSNACTLPSANAFT